jgi:hypothetical protein
MARRSDDGDPDGGKAGQGSGRKYRRRPITLKRSLAAARLIGPVVAPFALRAAGELRHRVDQARARRLGVPVGDLPKYSGRGAALHARLAGAATGLRDLSDRHADTGTSDYVARTEPILADLTAAVRAAERMPTDRRRAAHRAVATELDAVEAELLRRLGA